MTHCEHKYNSVIPLRGENKTMVICSDCGYTVERETFKPRKPDKKQ